MRQEGEPSVGEILRSIKKVMARDNRDILREERRREYEEGDQDQPPEPAEVEQGEAGHHQPEHGVANDAESDRGQVDADGGSADEAAVTPPGDDQGASSQSEPGGEPGEAGWANARKDGWGGDETPDMSPESAAASDRPAAESAAETPAPGSDAEPLTADETAEAMRQSLAALALLAEPSRPGESPMENMARQMLRPMLSQWLDTHLPGIVERQVKAEIARIVGSKG